MVDPRKAALVLFALLAISLSSAYSADRTYLLDLRTKKGDYFPTAYIPSDLKKPKIGIAFSGGGPVRGMVHLGVIKFFEEKGISADYVTGTSIGAITGGLDFSNYFTGLSNKVIATNLADAKKQGLAWGNFLTLTLNFIIVAFVLFLVIRVMNQLKRKDEAAPAPPKPTREEELLTEIRDLLKKS
jgi:large conductance mechanosensitive channel protein